MPTARNGLQILNLHPKKRVMEKNFINAYLLDNFPAWLYGWFSSRFLVIRLLIIFVSIFYSTDTLKFHRPILLQIFVLTFPSNDKMNLSVLIKNG